MIKSVVFWFSNNTIRNMRSYKQIGAAVNTGPACVVIYCYLILFIALAMAMSDQMVEDGPRVDYYELSQSEYRTMRAELKAYRLKFANRRATSSAIISGTDTTDVVDTSISLEGSGSSVVTNRSNSPASTGRKKRKQRSRLLLKDLPVRKTYIKTGSFRPLIKENATENTIVVHDLPEDACEASLIRKFLAFGTLCKVSLARDTDTGMLSGMAHVSYASIDDAERAWIKLREDGFESMWYVASESD